MLKIFIQLIEPNSLNIGSLNIVCHCNDLRACVSGVEICENSLRSLHQIFLFIRAQYNNNTEHIS